ncbi:MAG: hypothetical protein H7326_06060 [Bdellovibrionaceae bacterium]|nr:hypothetical protein [Pseudobdellovibrionaceae bacterium]
MTLNLELEIKSLLEQHRNPEVVAEKLISLYAEQTEKWPEESFFELCRFLLNCGLYKTLIQFCLENLQQEYFTMPWAFFVQALTMGLPDLEEDVVQFIIQGIQEQNGAEDASLARGAAKYITNSSELKTERRRRRQKYAKELKSEWLQQLITFRTQQLFEQEKSLLGKLQRMFPGDTDIMDEFREHKERNALDVLARRSPISRGTTFRDPAPSVETQSQIADLKESMLAGAKTYPDLAFDFAIAAYMLEAPELSLTILENSVLTLAQRWFLVEVKLRCRRFLDVLSDLNQLELAFANDGDTFFSTAYLRAQAYWGLNQKHLAIEILETILASRPHFRSAAALLDAWRTQ